MQAVLQARLPDSSGVERRWLAEVRVDICRGRNAHPTASTIGTGVVVGQEIPTPEVGIAGDEKGWLNIPEKLSWEIEGP